jgi:nicotinate dehydrogenase subunit B
VGLDTHRSPNQGGTYSSQAMRRGGPQLQRAAAEARQALLGMASRYLAMPVSSLHVENGLITGTGDDNAFTSYGELIGERLFNQPFNGTAPLKSASERRLVGMPLPRKDIPLKAKGTYQHMQHQRLPGMLHGRIVRPHGQGAYRDGIQVVAVNEASISGIPARVLRQGNFLGVVAEREWDAVRAAAQLEVEWQEQESLPGDSDLYSHMEQAPSNERVVLDEGDVSLYENAAVRCEFSGTGPYQAHAPFAPNCALAAVDADSALVLCSSQDIYNTRSSIAKLLGLQDNQVRVQYHESSGTFGHSCWDDAAQAAALMSQLAGSPVRVQFMRHDEHGWDTYGPAHVGTVRVAADANGELLSYQYEGRQHHWNLVETTEQSALGTAAAEWPAFPAMQLNPLVLGGMYRIPNIRLLNHHLDGRNYLKGAWLRSPLDLHFAFISEQAIDDLAYQLGHDPLEFRRRNIADARWRGVLDAVAQAANWQDQSSAPATPSDTVLRGRGIGLGTHLASWGAAVAEVEVERHSGKLRILHLYGALDAGLTVNPSNVEQQIIGQLVQTASRMLLEEVRFDRRGVSSLDWDSYPILRIADCPEVTPIVVQQAEEAPLGAGEEVMAAAAAAIANAFFNATGKRLHSYPMTPERILAALA